MSNPVVKSFLAGSLSGTCSTLLFQPFDLVKTRLQVAAALNVPVMPSKGGITVNSPVYNIIRTIIQNESLIGLWKGTSPSFFRCVPGVGTYFCSLYWLKSKFFKNRKPGSGESLILGAGARSFTTICILPMTVVKTRFESSKIRYTEDKVTGAWYDEGRKSSRERRTHILSGKFTYPSIIQALFSIHRHEGARGLYRGVIATLLRDAPFSGIYLMLYNLSKSFYLDGGAIYNFGCGVVSGALASLISQPADVIKTKMQVNQSAMRISNVVLLIYKDHGFVGYFRGFAPRATRRTLMAALVWAFYEQMSELLKL